MPNSRPQVLIVEDDDATAEMFAEILKLSGCEVQRAADGQQALETALASLPALILLDLMMPGLSGVDFLEALRSHVDGRAVPVVVVTSMGLPGDVEDVMAAGAQTHLTKPVSAQELQQAVRRALLTGGV